MNLVAVNLVAVLVAALAAFVLGGLWYSPVLFGNQWMKLAGIKKKSLKKEGMVIKYLVYLIGLLLMSFVLANVLVYLNSISYAEGVITAIWLWLGFIAPITLGGVLWENKKISLWLLNNAYNILSLILMTVILVAWK